jgi:phenylalanyl-tRNA synthetase beta chain
MILDDSIGELKLGEALCENSYLNDDIIEIELTANRGDCLSIRGVARDLCAAYDKSLREVLTFEDEKRIGIGRILNVEHDDVKDIDLHYRAVEIEDFKIPLKIRLRIAQLEQESSNSIDSLMSYTTHATGVILRAYPYNYMQPRNDEKALISIKNDENSYASIFTPKKASIIGVNQDDSSKLKDERGVFIVEASYIDPSTISRKMFEKKIKSDDLYYRTSRGSEPDTNLGIQLFLNLLEKNGISNVYGGSFNVNSKFEEKIVTITLEDIESFVGIKVNKTKITHIFKNLGFSIGKSQGDTFIIQIPKFRHDIENKQDIVEEIVRLIGIDNIESKALEFIENNKLDNDYNEYKKKRVYRHRCANSGFNESIHFIFNSKELNDKYGFKSIKDELKLLNPIVNNMDTLRPTLILSLLEAASNNIKMGQKSVSLFEIGSVFDEDRKESTKLTLLFSGDENLDDLRVNGKSEKITFEQFSKMISNIVGDVEYKNSTTSHSLSHPYVCADVITDNKKVGEVFKLHPKVADDMGINDTFICELDFNDLKFELTQANEFSRYQASFRDLSLLIPKDMNFDKIKEIINQTKREEIVSFYPADIYEDDSLGENISLTVRFRLQSLDKTLEENDIVENMDAILNALNEKLGIGLR